MVGTNMAEGHVGVDLPDFRMLTTDLRRGTFHQSNQWVPIPEEYLDPPSISPSVSYTTAATPNVASTTSRTSGRTSVSTLTVDTRGGAAVQHVVTLSPDAEFTNITVTPGGTRRILREHRPPLNTTNAGNKFSIAWWLCGGCFPNCDRRATHAPFADASERTRLLTFCLDHLAAPAQHLTGMPG